VELQAGRRVLHLPAAPPAPLNFPTPRPGTPHRLEELGKNRSGAVLSGLLDPSKTRAGPFHAQPETKKHRLGGAFKKDIDLDLLDLGFLEFHMLARYRIVLLESELLGLGT
jgi:hypothetical protein